MYFRDNYLPLQNKLMSSTVYSLISCGNDIIIIITPVSTVLFIVVFKPVTD